jgi:hypothetical protein
MLSSDLIKPKINYIIATHALNTHRRKDAGDNYAYFVLRYNLYILSQNLTSNSNIKQITIVRPNVEDNVGYYNISPYDKIIEEKGIKVEYFDVEDKGISYTQYIKSFKKYTDFDYYIIVEDDYTVNIKYTDFDKILYDLYNKTFENNIGFLDCYSPLEGLHGHPHHSAITLGILSKKTIDKVFIDNDNIYIGQLEFSHEMTKKEVPIIDMNRAGFLTKILFWGSQSLRIEDYSINHDVDVFYTPIQYYYDNMTYYIKEKNITININNTYNIHNV